jgi:hypothetical protein
MNHFLPSGYKKMSHFPGNLYKKMSHFPGKDTLLRQRGG